MNSPEPRASSPCFLALDLGTTTLAGRLLSTDGTLLAEARIANPQRTLGADILTRLQRVEEGGGETLQQLLVEGIRDLVAELLKKAGAAPEQVVAAAAAGNPGICHLLLALPVKALLHPPHRSPLTSLQILPPEVLSLNLELNLHLFPAVSGFVGGDLVAVLFGCSQGTPPPRSARHLPYSAGEDGSPLLHRGDVAGNATGGSSISRALVLDLGTNAELALWDGTRWLATSAAAGPAFEAGNIACGMTLSPGAVTDVQLAGDRLQLAVQGGGTPLGLCGSGLLALVAAAREGGLIDVTGRTVAPAEVGTNLARYLIADGEGWAICFHRAARGTLLLTQDDVRQLQLAKGAVRAGIEVLLDRAGLAPNDISKVLLTGAFGAALPTAAVKGIALLPESMLDKLFCVPNGVLDGLAAFIDDPHGPQHLAALQAIIKPLPLSGTPAFERRFLQALEL